MLITHLGQAAVDLVLVSNPLPTLIYTEDLRPPAAVQTIAKFRPIFPKLIHLECHAIYNIAAA